MGNLLSGVLMAAQFYSFSCSYQQDCWVTALAPGHLQKHTPSRKTFPVLVPVLPPKGHTLAETTIALSTVYEMVRHGPSLARQMLQPILQG